MSVSKIYENILAALRTVFDPETGADVIRMRLVRDLEVDDEGRVTYRFRPSSPLCPIALPLIMEIIDAVKAVEGVTDQKVTVVDYVGAEELNRILSTLPFSKKRNQHLS
jgi:metal-sulfur cluster biosynthetic enzyme